MEGNELEQAISEKLDKIHAPYLVIGKKKEPNRLEEFWMDRLEALEAQYDSHVIKLRRDILDNRATKRQLWRKEEQIVQLKDDLKGKIAKAEELATNNTKLKNDLSLQEYKSKSLLETISKTDEVKAKVLQSLENERFERLKRERELGILKQKLRNLERDKRFLLNDVALKDSERLREEDQCKQLAQNKYNLIKNLTEKEQEKRIQAEVNMKLVDDVGRLLKGSKTQEVTLLRQRKEIDLMLEQMKQKKKEQEETLRKLGLLQKSIHDDNEDRKLNEENVQHLERQIMMWKDEFQMKEEYNRKSGLEIGDLRRENSQLRCQVAELRHKLGYNDGQLKALESERRRTEIELTKAKGQSRSLHLQMCRNEAIRQKLAAKILKAHPHIGEALDAKENLSRGSRGHQVPPHSKEIASYKKKVWDLERQKGELETEIKKRQGKHDRLIFKLKKYDGMEKEILWTEKAMTKLEGEKNRLEDLLKSMALKGPLKVPFEKLVTDPSIMDRMANYQILQQRLLQQTGKVEKLKASAVQIMEYRRMKTEAEMAEKRIKNAIPKWKLSHWKYGSEDTLADIDQKLLDQEGQQGQPHPPHPPPLPHPQTLPSLVDRKYYKDYMDFLEKEIPQIKKDITSLERKQQCSRNQKLDEDEKRVRRKASMARGRVMSIMSKDLMEEEKELFSENDEEAEDEFGGICNFDGPDYESQGEIKMTYIPLIPLSGVATGKKESKKKRSEKEDNQNQQKEHFGAEMNENEGTNFGDDK